MEDEVILTRTAKIWLGEDGITRITYFRNTEDMLVDAKEMVATVWNINKGKKTSLLVDKRVIKSMDREAREYYAGEEAAKTVNATALLIGSPVSRIIANFYIRLNKPKFPVKLFTSETEAIEWLKGFME